MSWTDIGDTSEAGDGKIAGMEPEIARKGALVFAAGMVLAGVSFVVEQAVINAFKNRG